MLDAIKRIIVHRLYISASNGVLKRGAKALCKEFPEHISFIKMCCKPKSPMIMMQLNEINTVANAFRINRIAAGIKEPFNALV